MLQVHTILKLAVKQKHQVSKSRTFCRRLCMRWKYKLHDALWAYRTAYKTPIGMSPYQLVYRKTCHLPIELEFRAYCEIKMSRVSVRGTLTNAHNERTRM